jgi:serine/threonine-protein kinase
VWALGVILYEMLTGEPAFQGETLGDIFAKIREEDLPHIRTKRFEVPEGLADVLTKCLCRDREKRTPDAVTLRRALLPYTGADTSRLSLSGVEPRMHVEAAVTIAAPLDAAAPQEKARVGTETLATWTGDHGVKRRSALLVGGGLAALLIGAGAWLVTRGTPPAAAPVHGTSTEASATPPPTRDPPPSTEEPVASAPRPSASTPVVTVAESPSSNASADRPGASHEPPKSSTPARTGRAPAPSATPAPPPKKQKEDLGI